MRRTARLLLWLILLVALAPLVPSQVSGANHVVLVVEPVRARSEQVASYVDLMTDILQAELAQIRFFRVAEQGTVTEPDLRFHAELFFAEPVFFLNGAISDLRSQSERSAFEIQFTAEEFYRALDLLIAELNEMAHYLVLPPTEESVRVLLELDSPMDALAMLRTLQATSDPSESLVSEVREALAADLLVRAEESMDRGAYAEADSRLRTALAMTERNGAVLSLFHRLLTQQKTEHQKALSQIERAGTGLFGTPDPGPGLLVVEEYRYQLEGSREFRADFRLLEAQFIEDQAVEIARSAERAHLLGDTSDARRQFRAAVAVDPTLDSAVRGLARAESTLDAQRSSQARPQASLNMWSFAVRPGTEVSALFALATVSDPTGLQGGSYRANGPAIRGRFINSIAGPIHWSLSAQLAGLLPVGRPGGFIIEAEPSVFGHLIYELFDFAVGVSTPALLFSAVHNDEVSVFGGVAAGGAFGVTFFDAFRLELGFRASLLNFFSPQWLSSSRITIGGSYRHETE